MTDINVNRNIFLIYIYKALANSLFILPVLVPYYRDHIGLTYQQFLIGEAIFAVVLIAMEIPSGWLSDVWSRRKTLVLGAIINVIGFVLLIMADNFWMAMIAQGVLGVGVACNSGTITSLLYDSLATQGREYEYQKLEGKSHGIGLYAVGLSAVVGGILYQFHPQYPLTMDILFAITGVMCAFLIQEPPRVKRPAEKTPLHDMMITMKYALHGHKEIAGIILVSTVLFCSTKLFMWTQQPYMTIVGIDEAYFGYIIAAGFLFGGLCGHYGHRIKINGSNRQVMLNLILFAALFAVLAAIIQIPIAILFLLALSGVWGFGFPFIQNAINKHADPTRRATILSTLGLLISLAFIPFSLILGWVSDAQSIAEGIIYLSVQLIVLGIIGLYIWQKGTVKKGDEI